MNFKRLRWVVFLPGHGTAREDGDLERPRALFGIGGQLLHERGQIAVVHRLVAAAYEPRFDCFGMIGFSRLSQSAGLCLGRRFSAMAASRIFLIRWRVSREISR